MTSNMYRWSVVLLLVLLSVLVMIDAVTIQHPRVYHVQIDENMLLFNYGNVTASPLIAAFDYDSTLGIPPAWEKLNDTWNADGSACAQTQWVLPNTRHIWWWAYREWKMCFNSIPQTMLAYHKKGYKLVIMSNQYVLSYRFDATADYAPRQKKQDWVSKLLELCDEISRIAGEVVPIQVYGALQQDHYNKPCIGMWATAMAYNSPYNQIDCSRSFYVGDADGRISGTTSSPDGSDFSAGDFQYSISAGIGYMTPEQAFLGSAPPAANQLNQCMRYPEYTWCDEMVKKVWCLPGTEVAHPNPNRHKFLRPV